MMKQDEDIDHEFRVRAHSSERHRTWERWRRVARDVLVVARHVAMYVIARLHVAPALRRSRRMAGPVRRRATAAQHARAAIEELGPTAIKLGQILSTRDDVLPPDWEHELARLQDAAPLVPPEAIRAAIVRELGRPLHDLFASFVDIPLARHGRGSGRGDARRADQRACRARDDRRGAPYPGN